MNKASRKLAHNVLQLPTKPRGISHPAQDFPGDAAVPGAPASAGSPGDPRMQESIRLIRGLPGHRGCVGAWRVDRASLVTHDWVQRVQRRLAAATPSSAIVREADIGRKALFRFARDSVRSLGKIILRAAEFARVSQS